MADPKNEGEENCLENRICQCNDFIRKNLHPIEVVWIKV